VLSRRPTPRDDYGTAFDRDSPFLSAPLLGSGVAHEPLAGVFPRAPDRHEGMRAAAKTVARATPEEIRRHIDMSIKLLVEQPESARGAAYQDRCLI